MFDSLNNLMRWRLPAPIIGIALFFACTPAQAGLFDILPGMGQTKRVELTDNADKADVFKQAFPENNPIAPADFTQRKIAIASLQIEFVTEHLGTGRSNDAAAVKTYTLKGVTDTQMQSVADNMYREFAALLTKRGFEVVPTEALMNTSFKTELMVPNDAPVHYDSKGAISDAAYAAGVIKHAKKADNHQAGVTVTAKGTAPNAFETKFMSAPAARNAADELGIAVVQARLTVGFMQIDASGGLSSDVEGKPRNVLAIKDSRYEVFWPASKMAMFSLKKPVLLSNSVSDKVTELGMTTTEKVGVVAQGVFGAVSGLVGLGKNIGETRGLADAAGNLANTAHSAVNSGHFEVTAGDDYEEKVSKDIRLALEMYAEALPK